MVDSLDADDTDVDALSNLAPRRERDACTASIAFLWEAYRMVLDLLRNNSKFEVLYQQTARKAFEFCVKFNRKIEFKRLSDALNVHLQTLNRPQYVTNRQQPSQAINLSDPDVLRRFLDTRFLQLQTATELELWQESFRSAEDICGLLLKAAEAIAPTDPHTSSSVAGLLPFSLLTNKQHGTKMMQMLVQYYEKLTRIFAFSDDPVFLAAAWNEYYSWTINAKSTTPVTEESQRNIASHVLLATLCSPVLPSTSPADAPIRNHRKDRLTKMLGWRRVPDRAVLLGDAAKKNIISYAHQVVRQLYRVLEEEFHPLEIAQRMRPLLPQLQEIPEFRRYVQPLASITVFKVLQHISSIYTNITFNHLISLVSVFDTPISLFELEKLIFQFNRLSNSEIRANHILNQFYFHEKAPKLPPIDLLLHIPLFQEKNNEKKKAILKIAKEKVEKEHLQVHERQNEIEIKKKQLEKHVEKQIVSEKKEIFSKQNEEQEALQKKLAEAARQRELEKIQQQRQLAKKSEVKQISETLKKKAGISIKADALNEIGREDLLVIEQAITKRSKEALKQEMNEVMRKLEHMERVIRKNEIPILEKMKEEEKKRNRELAIELRKKAVEEAKIRHEQALLIMKRVQRMRKEADAFRGALIEAQKDVFLQLRERANAELKEEKQIRRDELRKAIQRKLELEEEERRKQEEAEKAEQERLKQAEERKKKEEKERILMEESANLREKEKIGAWIPESRKSSQSLVSSQSHLDLMVRKGTTRHVTDSSTAAVGSPPSVSSPYIPKSRQEPEKKIERSDKYVSPHALASEGSSTARSSDVETSNVWIPSAAKLNKSELTRKTERGGGSQWSDFSKSRHAVEPKPEIKPQGSSGDVLKTDTRSEVDSNKSEFRSTNKPEPKTMMNNQEVNWRSVKRTSSGAQGSGTADASDQSVTTEHTPQVTKSRDIKAQSTYQPPSRFIGSSSSQHGSYNTFKKNQLPQNRQISRNSSGSNPSGEITRSNKVRESTDSASPN
ncbi:eukaryotic translation initiation factor 3 subunit A [Coelomomyces lativittatus]|nr:eukaryotic translation initiation factor 3 subunit A [Coelomomyces lativittatus]KAJ1515230.1 eukaryotic translation initiation factor 3 subunit A [Coelomomyces lativittatus]